MKNFISFYIALLISSNCALAQYEPARTTSPSSHKNANELATTFIGIGTGLHYKFGILGVGLGYRVAPSTIAELNFGLGSYGTKAGIGAVFHVLNRNAWCPSLSFSRASGIASVSSTVEVLYNGGTYTLDNVKMKYDPMLTLTPGIQRQIITSKGNRMVFEAGIAIALNQQHYGFVDQSIDINGTPVATNSLQFTDTQTSAFKALSPSGLMLGFSYNFGMKNRN